MADVEIKPVELHWLEGSDPFADCCAHGGVYIRLGNNVLSDGSDKDWTLSTASFNLLKSIRSDHVVNKERPLVPHCGHTMWIADSEPDNLYLGGCDIGIDWTVKHASERVLHELAEDSIVATSLDDWRNAVCAFSDTVYLFFMSAWPKKINDEEDRRGFELFMNLWKAYREDAFD